MGVIINDDCDRVADFMFSAQIAEIKIEVNYHNVRVMGVTV